MSEDTATPTEPTTPPPFVLEEGKRFSQSIMWKLTRDFYEQRGISAWDSGIVPSYVTSNPFIAQTYAQVAWQYLRDCLSDHGHCKIDPTQPIYIIELAAGHGRFSYLFLKKFLALKNGSSLKHLDIRFVMTDFTETNVKSWAKQKLFSDFMDEGVLQLALFDLETDDYLRLYPSGKVLSQDSIKNPMIVFANYIFDSLLQDFFRFEGGKIQECLLTTRHTEPLGEEPINPEAMSNFHMDWELNPIAPNGYYGDSLIEQVLSGYEGRLSDTTLVFPVGAMRTIRRLSHMSGLRLLILSSDKGYTHEDELFYIGGQYVQFHGALSTMTNYHAMGQLVQKLGGHYLATNQRQMSLKTVAYLVGGTAEIFADTITAFRNTMDVFGPYDFYTLLNSVRNASSNLSIDGVMELMRISQYDPQVFFDYEKVLLDNAHNLSETQRVELMMNLDRTWHNFYPLGRDLPFELGRVYLSLKRPREALRYNQISMDMFGEHPVTFCNMGICYYQAEDMANALLCFEKSLERNPDYGLPKAWLARIQAEQQRHTG
ncbi:MAG TPA: hypothetical protein PKE31_15225 [Pseudomonadota bacterium]|nr:hypothetical protein [Pseudomonadota bacterium]